MNGKRSRRLNRQRLKGVFHSGIRRHVQKCLGLDDRRLMSFIDVAQVMASKFGWPTLVGIHRNDAREIARGYWLEYCKATHVHLPALSLENFRGKESGQVRRPWEMRRPKGNPDFYTTKRWLALRYDALKRSDGRCELCGSSDSLHVDHIKPRSLFPELAYEPTNLQVLCRDCNFGKGNRDSTDWRDDATLQ